MFKVSQGETLLAHMGMASWVYQSNLILGRKRELEGQIMKWK